LITYAIGDFHEKIVKSDAYERANIATCTLMKICHCIDENEQFNQQEDSEVSIQHLKEYSYAMKCSMDNILRAVKEDKLKRDKEHIKDLSKKR